jgi:hypothetical protein
MIEVDLAFGGLASVSRLSLLNGANAAAILSDAGIWEVVQFELAEEISSDRWRLSNLLRGQGGTDDAMREGASAGNRFVLIDSAVVPLGLTLEEAGPRAQLDFRTCGRRSRRCGAGGLRRWRAGADSALAGPPRCAP